MLAPIKLKGPLFFVDPLQSHNCTIEEEIHEITETWGGFEAHPFGDKLPSIRNCKVSVHCARINKILGVEEQKV